MKKTLVALAALAATAAFAQSSVTLSGGVRAALQNSGAAGAKTVVGANDVSVNNITITAVEDLGGGMKATGVYHMRNNLMTGEVSSGQAAATVAGGNANWRNSFATIGGNFGEVKAGRWGLSGLYGFDPFGATGTVYTFSDGIGGRYNSMMQYMSPNMGGVSAQVGVSLQGVAGTEEAQWVYVNYAAGPIAARIFSEKNQAATATQNSAMGLGLSYNMGVANLIAGFATRKGVVSGATVSQQYNIGATIPAGAAMGKVGYLKDQTSGRSVFAAGVDYSLSKTTALFVDIGKDSTVANATWQVGFQKGF